ncbi:hypothetical protein EVJ58_g6113 [Rhodofomes roseus]|nr:hypothetical protein EVJ58_g6113 [Rhodofomes roseus]
MMFRRASDEFDKMLSGGFCESVSASFAAEPTFGKLEVPIDEYGYESDSDLGDAEDEPSNDETTKHAAPSAVQDSSTEEDDQRARNIIDSSGETTANREKNQQAVQTAQSVKVDAASGSAQRSPSGCIGRTVFVKDMAYKT